MAHIELKQSTRVLLAHTLVLWQEEVTVYGELTALTQQDVDDLKQQINELLQAIKDLNTGAQHLLNEIA